MPVNASSSSYVIVALALINHSLCRLNVLCVCVSLGWGTQRQIYKCQHRGVTSPFLLLVTALIVSNIIDHTRARPPPERPCTEVACCHGEHVRGVWPVSVSLVASSTTLLRRVSQSVAEAGREINGRRWSPSYVSR